MGSNRYAVYFASPLTGGYGEAYSGGNLTPQFAGDGLQDGRRRGRRRLAGVPGGLRGGGADPPRRRRVGARRLRVRGAPPGQGRRAQGQGVRHRARRREPGALRLRQQREVAPPGARRPGHGHGLEEGQGHRLARHAEALGRQARGLRRPLQGHGRAGQGRRRGGRLQARRHGEHGAPAQRRRHLPHAVLAEGQRRVLRGAHGRAHARDDVRQEPGVPAVHAAVRQAQHRQGRTPGWSRDRRAGVRDHLRLRWSVRDQRLDADHAHERHLRPAGHGHDERPATLRRWPSRRAGRASSISGWSTATPTAWPSSSR